MPAKKAALKPSAAPPPPPAAEGQAEPPEPKPAVKKTQPVKATEPEIRAGGYVIRESGWELED